MIEVNPERKVLTTQYVTKKSANLNYIVGCRMNGFHKVQLKIIKIKRRKKQRKLQQCSSINFTENTVFLLDLA